MIPLVSIIIPTANRPQYLPRAVDSALAGIDSDEVEVIVVPNGPDVSWKQSLASYAKNPSVRILPIATPHANAARNHGMAYARGKFIRFLDDDDYLYPASFEQTRLLESNGKDVSVGSVNLVDENGTIFKTWRPEECSDFTKFMLRPSRITATCAIVYKKEAINDCEWSEKCSFGQDTDYNIKLACFKEISMASFKEPTGSWVHHAQKRISSNKGANSHNQKVANILFESISYLESYGKLTRERKEAAVEGLWFCIHSAFFRNPKYWYRIARITQKISPSSRPNLPFYNNIIVSKIDPDRKSVV